MRPGRRSIANAPSTRFWGILAAALALGVSLSGAATPAKRRPAPAPRPTAARSPSPAPVPTATPSRTPEPTPEPTALDGRIPRTLRGKARTRFMLAHWQELASRDLGEFAFAHATARTLHPGSGTLRAPLSMPLAVAKALPVLFPDRYKQADFSDFGFIPDPDDPDGLPVGFKTGGTSPRYAALSCAACHTGLVRGKRVPGAPNAALRYGDFLLAWEQTLADAAFEPDGVRIAARQAIGPLPESEDAELARWMAARPRPPYRTEEEQSQIAAWGAGRANYRGRGVPARFPSLWGMGGRYMSDGAWTHLAERNRYAMWRLGVPLESLRSLEANRLFRALIEYLGEFEPPPGTAPARGLALRGAEVYKTHCASCHDRPGDLLLLEQVGTDDRLLREDSPLERLHLRFLGFEGVDVPFWPRIKIPALSGMAARHLLLHNGSVQSLEDLLAPDRRPPILSHAGTVFDTRLPGHSNRGHGFGADLEPDDRAALLAFLRSL